MTSPIKTQPVIKVVFSTVKVKLLEQQRKLLIEIAELKDSIKKYEAAIYDIKAKIDARKKAGITDNMDLDAKLKALIKARNQANTDLTIMLMKLAYIEAKLK